jgi:hypothetical protein
LANWRFDRMVEQTKNYYDNNIEMVKQIAIQAESSSKNFAECENPRFWFMNLEEKEHNLLIYQL